MIIRARSAAILMLVLILGGILILQITGLWVTEGKRVPTKIASGDSAGMANPADIRGSYTFGDIETHFSIPAKTLALAYGLDSDTQSVSAYQAKQIEEYYEGMVGLTGDIGTDSLKLFVALYAGIPYEPEVDTQLPSTAVEVLLTEAKISAEQLSSLEQRIFQVDSSVEIVAPLPPAPIEPTTNEETLIKGNTTFANLLDWGLNEAEIEQVLGTAMPPRASNIRDYLTQQGLEFSVYKLQLQQLVDAK